MKQVAIFLPSRCSNVSTDLDDDGTGAREQVADWLAFQLTRDGYDVHVFTNQREAQHFQSRPYAGEIHYIQQELAEALLTTYEWDALVSFDFPVVATIPNIKKTVKKIVLSHNYYGTPPEGTANEEALSLIDSFVYPSEWAARECAGLNGHDLEKGIVIPYAADPRFFSTDLVQPNKNRDFRFIYANQAEAGLAQMLKMWPQFRDTFNDPTLTIATPVDEFVQQIQWSSSIQSELALDIRDLIDQPGIRYIGRQGRAALARELSNSDALLYPCEPLSPLETGSLPMIQALACGVPVFFNDADALGELYGKLGKIIPSNQEYPDEFLEGVEDHVPSLEARGRDSERIAQDWIEFLC